MNRSKKGYLLLEDGTIFDGELIGGQECIAGEVVFNTSMVGYEQVISDPSYAGQIIVMTYPLIGNYGVKTNNLESNKLWLRGLIVRNLCPDSGSSHYQNEQGLESFLIEHRIPCITGVDTRKLTRHIRNKGTMGGIITSELDDTDRLQQLACYGLNPPAEGFVMQVTRNDITKVGTGKMRAVLMDFGTKKSIVSQLEKLCKVIIVPADSSFHTIMELNPDILVLSNGPGDPEKCQYAVNTVKKLLGKIPMFGICLGHQIIALALGAKTYKLTFGHRGGNHPVKDLRSGRVYMTSQNHGYSVDASSLKDSGAQVIFNNINDNTVEGLYHEDLSIMSVQFHPEAAPGPRDTMNLLNEFVKGIDLSFNKAV